MSDGKIPTQRDLSNLVDREVIYCVSSLVFQLALGYGDTNASGDELAEQAFNLGTPIDDYEEAAIQEGWTIKGDKFVNPEEDMDGVHASPPDWQHLCDEFDIQPYQREIFEHWIVSSWLADKLETQGERIDRDFAGLVVWGRTTTGQAIAMDSIIEAIWLELHASDKE